MIFCKSWIMKNILDIFKSKCLSYYMMFLVRISYELQIVGEFKFRISAENPATWTAQDVCVTKAVRFGCST